jgi:hypothetical protein
MLYRIAILLACAGCAQPADRAAPSPAGNPFQVHAVSGHERRWLDGRVLERIATGPYVYLRLRESSGRLAWLVSLRATTPADASVRALVVGRAERFQSRRLGREFSPLLFAAVRSASASENPKTLENAP